MTILINDYCICYRYRLNAEIQDTTGNMTITIFGRAAQALIKKPCSALTIDEGFTDPYIIPPAIDQLKGQTKIFQIYFQQRGTQISTIVSKTFEDNEFALPPPQIPTATTTEAKLPPPQMLTASAIDPKTPDPKKLATRYCIFIS